MTYGAHRDRAQDALAFLLTSGRPVTDAEWPTLRAYRAATLMASLTLAERAVRGGDVHVRLFPRRPSRPSQFPVITSSPTVFVGELERYPRLVPEDLSLTDALSQPHTSRTLRAWADVARHWTLASETLLDRPEWTHRAKQTWAVLADVSDVVEALVVLDRDVIGRTPESAARQFWRANDDLRLVARYVNMLSLSGETIDVSDLRRRNLTHGLVLVQSVADLEPATQRLTELVEQRTLTARELKSFALVQADLARRCAGLAGAVSGPGEVLRRAFDDRYDAYRALAATTGRLGSINRAQGRLVLAQLNEIGLAVGRLSRDRAGGAAPALAELHRALTVVDRALGHSIQRAVSSGSYLTVDDDRVRVGWRRIRPGETPSVTRAGMRLVTSAASDVGFAAVRLAVASNPASASGLSRAESFPRPALRQQLDRRPFRRPRAPNEVLKY